jgi:hypothetical protein
MDCESLRQRLEAAGCSESSYSIGCRNDGTLALEPFGDEWWVFYTERGIVNEPEFRSTSEAEACAYLWEKMQHVRHDHLVGVFSDSGEAQEFVAWLERLGLPYHLNPIPHPVVTPTMHRVFVHGKAIFEVRKHLPSLPIRRWREEK